jgi:hypothetical protein
MRFVPGQPRRPRSRRVQLLLWCALGCFAAAVPAPAAAQTNQALRIVPLVRDDHVLVSFSLTDGFTDDVRAAIRSGLKTTFTYSVELRLDVPGWVDRTIGASTVTNSVEYDNLHRRYKVVRVIDGRVESGQETDDEAVVRQWLTNLSKLSLFRTSILEPNREYYVRVQASARPSNGSILWPFGSGTSAQAKFTFIR